jgi:hypothetical protein
MPHQASEHYNEEGIESKHNQIHEPVIDDVMTD